MRGNPQETIMLTSKTFYIASLVAGLATAYGVWNGDNVLATMGISVAGGFVIGAVVWFMYGKIADFMK